MKKWIFTGISGSGRIEFVEEIAAVLIEKKIRARSHDLGSIMRTVCKENRIEFDEQKILDIDAATLKLVRALAIKEIETEILKDKETDFHFIGVHLTFKWKGRLIPGFTTREIRALNPDGFVNVIDDVEDIYKSISKNQKWSNSPKPDIEEIQYWLMEEEFCTNLLGELCEKPVYLVARKHNENNIAELFTTNKKKIYLSYPITAIKDSNPELLNQIQDKILIELEKFFIVFNPLSIEDMKLTYLKKSQDSAKYPKLISQIDEDVIELIKTRTVHRDYQFIDQSDAIVVFYMTDKLSPGVMGEMYYAHRNQKPIFIAFDGSRSPFLTDISHIIETSPEKLFPHLEKFSHQ